MFDRLNSVLVGRIKGVLESHFTGTDDQLETAAIAVVDEFTSIGVVASGLPGVTANLSMELQNQREQLAKQLALTLSSERE